jgi:hypothetical protein
LNAMPGGLARNHAIESLVGSLASEDPRAIAAWAATITWLPTSGLSAAAQHAVMQPGP